MRKRITMYLATLMLVGCTSYYKVTDPTTGKTYYTTELKQKRHGAASLKDARTGNTVNLQNSEIAKVSKDEYNAGRYSSTAEPEKASANPVK